MQISQTELPEVYLIRQELKGDSRGFFSRIYCKDEFIESGIEFTPIQANRSVSKEKFTLRGLHYQINESAEDKYIRVISGAILDVAVDIRPNSKTYLKHIQVHLSDKESTGIYIPKGFAHGMLTLSEYTEIEYLVSAKYSPTNERGVRWNDPQLNINWPQNPLSISDKDSNWPLM